jgi:hypothetical protein
MLWDLRCFQVRFFSYKILSLENLGYVSFQALLQLWLIQLGVCDLISQKTVI